MSTRKLRLVADSIRSLTPTEALSKLSLSPKQASVPMIGVIESAIANARQKEANTQNLRFKTIEVMGGPGMKRWHAISRGSAHGYKKRMTHVRVVLIDANVPSPVQKEVQKPVVTKEK